MTAPTSKKVFVKTFGCQMNEYDSDKMADVLQAAEGYEKTTTSSEADLILFNTCSVREKAQEKVFSDLGPREAPGQGQGRADRRGRLRGQPGRRGDHRACALRRSGVRPADAAPPAADDRCAKRSQQRRPQVDISFPEIEKFDHLPPPRVEGASAFVSIMEGCSKYCSYCVVPYTRGEEVTARSTTCWPKWPAWPSRA